MGIARILLICKIKQNPDLCFGILRRTEFLIQFTNASYPHIPFEVQFEVETWILLYFSRILGEIENIFDFTITIMKIDFKKINDRNECETLIPVATTSHGLKPEQVCWFDLV